MEVLNVLTLTLVVAAVLPLALALVPARREAGAGDVPLPRDGSGRITFFDAARGVAILAVIVIHVTRLYPGEVLSIPQLSVDAINNLMRFAIAVFFISSGALLTHPGWRARALGAFYLDKVVRLAIPYAIVVLALGFLAGSGPREMLIDLVTGGASVPFYFIIVLFQLYLIYPLLYPLARRRWFVYATLAFSLVAFLSPWSYYFADVPLFFRFLFFFAWGIYAGEMLREGRVSRAVWPWAMLGALFLLLMALLPELERYYNFRPYYGVAIFMLLYLASTRGWWSQRIERGFAWIGGISLWIFLTHYAFMEAVRPYVLQLSEGWPLFALASVVSLGGSVALAWVCARAYRLLSTLLTKGAIWKNTTPWGRVGT
jgi:peptidoglycan/LPS O-acetylase OafA/YrhL